MTDLPRGIRNNNPGNIRWGPHFEGLDLTVPRKDPDFCVFVDMPHGVRGLALVLRNYQRVDGLKTLAEMVHRWAPPEENDTTNYLKDVCGHVGVDYALACSDYLLTSSAKLASLTAAIAFHENAGYILRPADLSDGVSMAMKA